MTPLIELGMVMYSLTDFYGLDHPDYLDIYVELSEDRDRITALLGNAILHYQTSTREQFRELIFTNLCNMGFDIEEEQFYEKFYNYVVWIASRTSSRLPREEYFYVDAIEDSEWVNVIYRCYPEAK